MVWRKCLNFVLLWVARIEAPEMRTNFIFLSQQLGTIKVNIYRMGKKAEALVKSLETSGFNEAKVKYSYVCSDHFILVNLQICQMWTILIMFHHKI
ncbi:hypothetical protein Zmor_015074 [Zophobas morio]|uniref:Uncharacterized protein n=1 Tax=Zophobas morio TaxID=2755281 RepID=A0AA38IG36_9CUCU|nr:hypothetical protein Zmor_015074 [Zophobas morio]